MRSSYKIQFFKPEEFACRCGCGLCEPAAPLVAALDFMRRVWGAPIIVTSGCRCEKHNEAVGGAPASRHKAGLAADIRPRDAELMPALRSLARYMFGGLTDWELILAANYIHIAVPRPKPAHGNYGVWDGGAIRFSI